MELREKNEGEKREGESERKEKKSDSSSKPMRCLHDRGLNPTCRKWVKRNKVRRFEEGGTSEQRTNDLLPRFGKQRIRLSKHTRVQMKQ